ncbi:MAG: 1-deoxy-D-xylulose-5-phosphate reductoisomerase [Ignavibacteria bacterium]|nr:1-deoxy-D-xylulose-5-phosphate reductoisomerase [Ignavibacteria bacterium]
MTGSSTIKNVTILGSTGSIGIQTLQVIEKSNGIFNILYLTTNQNIDILAKQINKFKPKGVVISDYKSYLLFKKKYNFDIEILYGSEGLTEVASKSENDIVVSALVGFSGVAPTIAALNAGKNVALANKETLVSAGEHISNLAKERNAKIIAIDSEHNAIIQCLLGEELSKVEKIILTASGGPFLHSAHDTFEYVNVDEALAHPRWSMGKKISIDSATLMNKGFEVIEAHWLFNLKPEQIEVVIHPESIIHSLVQFVDGSIKAQLGPQDMRIPISFALNFPERLYYDFPRLDLLQVGSLNFQKPDTNKFPCLQLAYEALEMGGTAPAILNAANETAVQSFLEGKISFAKIPVCISYSLEKVEHMKKPTIEDIFETDKITREITLSFINKLN